MIGKFESQCKISPDAVCIQYEDDYSNFLTYHQVNSKASTIRDVLQKTLLLIYPNGYPKSLMVSIMLERNIGMVISILAILKLRAAYVPVDPKFPPDRQSHIFNQSESSLLIVDAEGYTNVRTLGVIIPQTIVIDGNTGEVLYTIDINKNKVKETISSTDSLSLRNNSLNYNGNDLAYILYTSGSTGKPKGVMITNKNVMNQLDYFSKEMNIGSNTIVLGLATFCFDISVLEIFLPILYGGKLIIVSSITQKDPFRIIDLINACNINLFQATPTTYEMLLATGWRGNHHIDFLVNILYL